MNAEVESIKKAVNSIDTDMSSIKSYMSVLLQSSIGPLKESIEAMAKQQENFIQSVNGLAGTIENQKFEIIQELNNEESIYNFLNQTAVLKQAITNLDKKSSEGDKIICEKMTNLQQQSDDKLMKLFSQTPQVIQTECDQRKEIQILKEELKESERRAANRESMLIEKINKLSNEIDEIKRKQQTSTSSLESQAKLQSQKLAPYIKKDDHQYNSIQNQNNQEQENRKEQTSNETNNQQNARIAVLIHSNRNNIDFRKLFGSANTETIPCKNIPDANYQIQRGVMKIEDPTNIIIHVGTNDLDIHKPEAVADGLSSLVMQAKRRYNSAKIHLLLLLPRNDNLQAAVMKVNRLVSTQVQQTIPGVSIIHHTTIGTKHLHDAKHLNRYVGDHGTFSGSQLFSKDMYKSVLGRDPSTDILASSRRWMNKYETQRSGFGYHSNFKY